MQIFYRVIYQPWVNYCLRSLLKPFAPILPNKFKLPPTGVINFSYLNKVKFKILTNQTNYLSYLCFWNGFEKFEYTSIFIKLISKVNVFFDIGANIGYYTVLAKKFNKDVRCYAFEPANGPYHFLLQNIKINKLSDVKIEKIALSDQEGFIKFFEVENRKYRFIKYNLAGEGHTGKENKNSKFKTLDVKTCTLDNYYSNSGLTDLDLIKMDTEGTEDLILSNSRIILEKIKPIIICETLFNKIEDKLENLLLPYGYEFYNHTNEGLIKTKSIKREIDNGVYNCFFVHPSKYHLIEEFVVVQNKL